MADIARILERAGTQHGAISRAQLRDLGVTRRQVDGLLAARVLRRTGVRTLVVDGWPPSHRQRLMAACLDTGGVAAVRSAAALAELGDRGHPHRPEVLCRRDLQVFRSPIARVLTTTWLPDDDLVRVDGIPSTSVARTLLSLAAPKEGLTIDGLQDLVDRAIADGKATDGWLWWRLERLRRRGRPGSRSLEDVLVRRADLGPTESWLERSFLQLLASHGLPLPRCQRRVDREGAFVGRVDFLFEERNLVIEVLGHRHHASPTQALADARRRNELQLAGFAVLEFTYDDVVHHPAHVIATVRAALAAPRRPSTRPA